MSTLPAWRPAATIGATYLAQGLVAYLGVIMVGMLAQLGTPLEQQVGLLASGALPWALKFAFALLLDLRPLVSLRVRALAAALLLASASVGMATLARAWAPGHASELGLVAWVWLASNFALALLDVLADALALERLADRRALAATCMGLGHALGFGVIGPLGLLELVLHEGLAPALQRGAVMVGVLALVPLVTFVAEPHPTTREPTATTADSTPISPWPALAALVLCIVAMLGPNVTGALASEFLFAALHWDFADFAAILLPLGAIAGLIGALLAGLAVARRGPAHAAAWMAALLGLAWLAFAAASPQWSAAWTLRWLAASEGALQAALLVCLHALALQHAGPSFAITRFVTMMAALNLPRVLGPMLAPSLVGLGWVAVFAGCGAASLLAAGGLALLARAAPGIRDARGIH